MTADLPLVSVVIPTRDRPHLLAIALECYRRQTYPNRELIVVDDGDQFPVDESAVTALGGQVLRVEPGLPLGSKLNVGIEASRGRFIQKMDDDDFYAPAFIETMYRQVRESWSVVARPTMAILMGFLFFDVARWEVRRSLPENAPGATLFFGRDDWEDHPFRGVPRDEDVWFYQDQIRLGGVCVTVDAPETFLAVRHAGSIGNRGHTWTRQLDGTRLETYLLDLPLYEGGPEALLPAWALEHYRALRSEILASADDGSLPPAHSATRAVQRRDPAEMSTADLPRTETARQDTVVPRLPVPRGAADLTGLAVSEFVRRLAEPRLPPSTYGALLDAATDIVSQGGDIRGMGGADDLDAVVALADCPHLHAFRTRLLHEVIEPALLARPELVTVHHLDLMAGRYGRYPSFRYLLETLARHPSVAAEVRAVADAGTAGQSPLREGIATRLGQSSAAPRNITFPDEVGVSANDLGSPRVLILTPVKDATPFFAAYVEHILSLTYPHAAISLGFLEGDSTDDTFAAVEGYLPLLLSRFRRVGLWRRDFGYQVPAGVHRGAASIQIERRAVLARSRNHLLSHALDDEDWVLWLDVDVVSYPDDLIQRLLAPGKEIVQPHCVLDPGGPTFDTNGWREHGRLHLDDLRDEGELVELDAVGATVLLVRADLHRDGLVFPSFLYGRESPWMRPGRGEIETEGLGMMARDMGHRAWGLPHLEVIHARH